MGTQRTSMKDVLAAIEAQSATLATLVTVLTAQAQTQVTQPVVRPTVQAPVNKPAEPSSGYDIPASYMKRMDAKVSGLTALDGKARVLYLRRNLNGETKLAFALKDRWDDGIKDNGLIGAVKVYS